MSARGRKAERCSATTVYNINSINCLVTGATSAHGIIHSGADQPHLLRLDDDDVSGVARPDAAAARWFARRAMLYLVAGRPEAKADETGIRARPASR